MDTVYERVGGEGFFFDLVDRFYARVESDSVLRPLYPSDLSRPRRHLAMFLAQYWGGPPAYNAERGHPRLRMRHAPFAIGLAERDAWLRHMLAAVDESTASDVDKAALRDYFTSAAKSLINRFPQRGATLGVLG
jgi:hemoglobin